MCSVIFSILTIIIIILTIIITITTTILELLYEMKQKSVAIDASHLNELLRSYIRSKQYAAAWEVFGVMMSNTSNSASDSDRLIVKMSEKLSSTAAQNTATTSTTTTSSYSSSNSYNNKNKNHTKSSSSSSSSGSRSSTIGIASLITDSYNITHDRNIRDKIWHANREDNIFNSFLKHSRQHELTYRLGMYGIIEVVLLSL